MGDRAEEHRSVDARASVIAAAEVPTLTAVARGRDGEQLPPVLFWMNQKMNLHDSESTFVAIHWTQNDLASFGDARSFGTEVWIFRQAPWTRLALRSHLLCQA